MQKYAFLLATASARLLTEEDVDNQIMEIEATMDLIKWSVSKEDAQKIGAAGVKVGAAKEAYQINPEVMKTATKNMEALKKSKAMKDLEKFIKEHEDSKDDELKKLKEECLKKDAAVKAAAEELYKSSKKTPSDEKLKAMDFKTATVEVDTAKFKTFDEKSEELVACQNKFFSSKLGK